MKRKIIILLSVVFMGSCNLSDDPDCSLVLCAPNDAIQLEIIRDGINIFASGDITTDDVTVMGTGLEESRYTVYNDARGSVEALLTIEQFGLVEDSYTYTIQIPSIAPFDIQVVFGLSDRDPCCGQRLLNQQVSSDDVTVEEFLGHTRILLD